MLEVDSLSVAYGAHSALQEASLCVRAGEIVVILGANGAGKSSLLRAIAGISEGLVDGVVTLNGENLRTLGSDAIVERGVALVPEGRGIFPDLSVRENLLLGAYSKRARDAERDNLERVLQLFPKLQERQGQIARTMSGGEQQMVGIGRAMMSAPSILMLDEPSLGLSPLLCKELFASLRQVRDAGIGILLVEQNAKQSLAIADRGYLLENTRITHSDTAQQLATDPAVQAAYLGRSRGSAGTEVVPHANTTDASGKHAPEALPTAGPAPEPETTNAAYVTREPLRTTADALIGSSIEDLVVRAAVKSRDVQAVSTGQAQQQLVRNGRIEAAIYDIEAAARAARRSDSSSIGFRTTAGSDSASRIAARVLGPSHREMPSSQAPEDEKPVVIEVYRAPRVEVYRRRQGSDRFDRD